MDPTIAVALTGLGGTLLAVAGTTIGPIYQAKQAARVAREARFDEQRTALYLEAITFVESLAATLYRFTEPTATDEAHPTTVAPRGDLTARMHTLAPPAVLAAWLRITAVDEDLTYRIRNDSGLRSDRLIPSTAQLAVDTRSAVAEFRAAVRAATGADR